MVKTHLKLPHSLLDEELESLEAILMDDVRIVRGAR